MASVIEEQLPRGWEVQRLWDRQECGGGSQKSCDWEEVDAGTCVVRILDFILSAKGIH